MLLCFLSFILFYQVKLLLLFYCKEIYFSWRPCILVALFFVLTHKTSWWVEPFNFTTNSLELYLDNSIMSILFQSNTVVAHSDSNKVSLRNDVGLLLGRFFMHVAFFRNLESIVSVLRRILEKLMSFLFGTSMITVFPTEIESFWNF